MGCAVGNTAAAAAVVVWGFPPWVVPWVTRTTPGDCAMGAAPVRAGLATAVSPAWGVVMGVEAALRGCGHVWPSSDVSCVDGKELAPPLVIRVEAATRACGQCLATAIAWGWREAVVMRGVEGGGGDERCRGGSPLW